MPATKSGPTAPKCTDEEFKELFDRLGGKRTSEILGGTERNVYARRRRIEQREGVPIIAPSSGPVTNHGRINLELTNGTILVGSDFHIWPGEESTCMRAFKKFLDDIRPNVVVLNGDVMDFPRISRHPQSWETAPDPQEEIEAAQDHLHDMVSRTKRGTRRIWTLGNHDDRFERMIANALPQYRKVKGVHLSDHFTAWEKAMSCRVNIYKPGGDTLIKHIPTGSGEYATQNNTKKGGIHAVHGHLHRQNVYSRSDYREHNTYGVDAGMVADKEHRAFSYTQDSPLDWREGFVLLTYLEGILMPPELITKVGRKTVYFRGALHRV